MEHLASVAQSTFMAGILSGNIVFGVMADKIGRRIPFIIACLMEFFFGIITAFSSEFWLFCVFRFFLAVAIGGTMNTGYIYVDMIQ